VLLQCSALRHPALPGLQSREHDPAEGHSVRELCQRPEYPVEDTIYRWIQQNPDFSEKYLAAREVQADRLADEVIPIVDGERPVLNDEPNKDSAVRVSRDMGRAKYRVWKAGRMSPRKWGERIDANSNLGGIAPSIIVIRDSTDVRAGGASKADHRKEHEGD
jgi:hypothetical protein